MTERTYLADTRQKMKDRLRARTADARVDHLRAQFPTLFATAAELGVPPVSPGDADLSRIRVTVPASLEEYQRLHAEMEAKRAERKARYDRINGTVDLTGLGAL